MNRVCGLLDPLSPLRSRRLTRLQVLSCADQMACPHCALYRYPSVRARDLWHTLLPDVPPPDPDMPEAGLPHGLALPDLALMLRHTGAEHSLVMLDCARILAGEPVAQVRSLAEQSGRAVAIRCGPGGESIVAAPPGVSTVSWTCDAVWPALHCQHRQHPDCGTSYEAAGQSPPPAVAPSAHETRETGQGNA